MRRIPSRALSMNCLLRVPFLLSLCAPLLLSSAGAHAQSMPTAEQVAFVKQCIKTPATSTEVDRLSRKASKEVQAQLGAAEVPLAIKLIAHRLIQASASLEARWGGVSSLDIRGYESPLINAQLNGTAGILVSSALWKASPALSPHEQAAVLAHELAHQEEQDLVLWGCFARSRLYPDLLSFSDAMDFVTSSNDPIVKQFLHEMESVADKRARVLLQAAGFDPEALDRVLSRPDLQELEPSFTHPGTRQRLQRGTTVN